MSSLSQNNKIAISAIAVFIVSFSVMLFFLENSNSGLSDSGKASVMHASEAHVEEGIFVDIEDVYKSYTTSDEDPIFVTNPEGDIKYSEQVVCDIFRSKCDAMDGELIFDHIDSRDLADFTGTYAKIVQTGESKQALGPYRIHDSLVLLSAFPIEGEEGVHSVVFAVKDITAQVERAVEEEELDWMHDVDYRDELSFVWS